MTRLGACLRIVLQLGIYAQFIFYEQYGAHPGDGENISIPSAARFIVPVRASHVGLSGRVAVNNESHFCGMFKCHTCHV